MLHKVSTVTSACELIDLIAGQLRNCSSAKYSKVASMLERTAGSLASWQSMTIKLDWPCFW